MNRIILLPAAVAAAALVSCHREPAGNRQVEITVTLRGAGTSRATDVLYSDESKVNNLQVYVFNEGRLEDYRDAGAAMTVQLAATSGTRTVWALVNAPALSGISTEEQLKKSVTHLSDNARNSFVMTGSTTQELVDGGSVPVTVRRIAARVSVGRITRSFQYGLADATLKVDAVYLINVAGDNAIAGGAPESWVNRLKHADAAYDTLLYDKVGATVGNSSPHTVEHVFYPYPNPVERVSHEAAWTPRHTMLVIEVTLDGQKGYYPVELPVLERNKSYVVEEVILKHRPGDVPYKPVETGDATVRIAVNDWETGLNLGTLTL